MVAQGHGADSASVIFDAMQSARAKGIDVLIADTAGRLQNKIHLMNELEKVVRVMKKADETAPHETMIVLDAGTGQNAINQVQIFGEATPLSGITITKLDGTAKGVWSLTLLRIPMCRFAILAWASALMICRHLILMILSMRCLMKSNNNLRTAHHLGQFLMDGI